MINRPKKDHLET